MKMLGRRVVLQLSFFLLVGFLGARFLIIVISVTTRSKKDLVENTPTIDLLSLDNEEKSHDQFASFVSGEPKKVVVLTYQRCGSSFFGQLFNTNPNVFYMYEPLDSLYSAMYGIREGWNVPSDITTYWNGTERIIPQKELHAVAVFLKHLLSCRVDNLPTETLIHRFWFLFSYFHVALRNFIKCLGKNNLKYTRCEAFTPGLCGRRFGEYSDDVLMQCNSYLWNDELRRSALGTMAQNMSRYRACIDGMRTEVDDKCTALFTTNCEATTLRTTKTVRATMASMEYLLKADDNLRVIHLIRDPRAVVLSRLNFDSSARSRYAGRDVVKEARVYCRDVVRDVRRRRLLDGSYPGRILTVIYDDLTRYPVSYAKQIYQFLDAPLHNKTVAWLIKNTSQYKNSTRIASNWQKKLSYQTAKQIMETCETFFSVIDYKFS